MATTTSNRTMGVSSGNLKLAWILLIIGVALAVAGIFFGWYTNIVWFDRFIHAYNFFAITLVVALYLYGDVLTGTEGHTFLLIVTIALIGLAFGALWEVGEFMYDWFINPAKDTIKE